MKNINRVNGQSEMTEETGNAAWGQGRGVSKNTPSPHPLPQGGEGEDLFGRLRVRALLCALAGLALAGCTGVPHTTIRGTLNGSPFLVEAPKDGDLTGFDLTADTNGVVRVHIEHLAVKMNPDVIGQSGAAQVGIIQATGAVASDITAAAVSAAVKGK